MIIEGKNVCPSCECEDYLMVGVGSSDGIALVTCIGEITLNICQNCGAVYLGKSYLERLENLKAVPLKGGIEK